VNPLGRATKPNNKFPALSAKEPPTQGHDIDMGTIQNTAALYLRKSSLDDRAGDNRSITDQRHDLERLADRRGLQIVRSRRPWVFPAGLYRHSKQVAEDPACHAFADGYVVPPLIATRPVVVNGHRVRQEGDGDIKRRGVVEP